MILFEAGAQGEVHPGACFFAYAWRMCGFEIHDRMLGFLPVRQRLANRYLAYVSNNLLKFRAVRFRIVIA